MVKIKRAYEPFDRADGYRVLVDRLWPRGIRKSKFVLDEWAKELAPSTELRKAFAHDPAKWKEFSAGYRRELRAPEDRQKLEFLSRKAKKGPVTLVYSARDEEKNNAVVLKAVLDRVA